ncbi:hypothetical protein P7K49_028503 [Saguinus oedipus]|uniref:Uncharacterized protein n=1 Tax=Saguinus oedipus TaxID=9490 RepID=A0ABQ9U5F3_SAGOE|nr:hypothetical protein P7K49_028503 [Saguinus oedipus]
MKVTSPCEPFAGQTKKQLLHLSFLRHWGPESVLNFLLSLQQALCQEHPQQFPTTTKVKMKGRRLRVEAEEAGGPPGLAGCLGHGLG